MTALQVIEPSFEEQLANLVGAAREEDIDRNEIISALELQLYAARDCEAEAQG